MYKEWNYVLELVSSNNSVYEVYTKLICSEIK